MSTDDRRTRGLARRAGAGRHGAAVGRRRPGRRDRRCATSWPTAGVALTTVHTVLTRLEQKGFVVHDDARPRRFSARASREDHAAELMHEVLGSGRRPAGRAGPLRRQRRRRRGAAAARAARRRRPTTPPPDSATRAARHRGRPSPSWPRCWPGRCRRCWPGRAGRAATRWSRWSAGRRSGWPVACRSIGALLVHGLAPWGALAARGGLVGAHRGTRPATRCAATTGWP